MTAGPSLNDLLPELRAREEDLLLRILSAYVGAVATVVAVLAAFFSPVGYPVAVFLVAEPVLCTAAGLGVAEYVLRRGGKVPTAGRTEEGT